MDDPYPTTKAFHVWRHADPVVRLTVAVLIILNETLFLPRLWIVSHPPKAWPARYLITPMTMTITYALSEPAWTWLFRTLYSQTTVWTFSSAMMVMMITFLHTLAGVTSAMQIMDGMHIPPRGIINYGSLPTFPILRAERVPKWVYPIFFIPVQTAAIINAALVTWSYDLHAGVPATDAGPGVDGFVNLLALVCCVGFGLSGDYAISEASHRDMFFRSGEGLTLQLRYLRLLLGLRWCIRIYMGLDMLPVLPFK